MNTNGKDGIRLTWAAAGIILTLLLNLVAGAVAYGKLNTTVALGFASTNDKIGSLQQEVRGVSERQRATDLEVARIQSARRRNLP